MGERVARTLFRLLLTSESAGKSAFGIRVPVFSLKALTGRECRLGPIVPGAEREMPQGGQGVGQRFSPVQGVQQLPEIEP